jgi:hypothetical protein
MVPAFSGACHASARQIAEQPDWNGFGGELASWPPQKRDELRRRLRSAIGAGRSVQKLREAIEKYFRAVALL